ncbi:hypothetical protein ZIOFF_065629 [Zingiber officinale]|uniref:Uncharacterized protein n=1 Tax=Zingiber officinale TaxID=94328 RepID=A0A8J5EXJ8_ZINOF|nr:hypothetical protein ZIOFF_065629 [Zingiber officinale]
MGDDASGSDSIAVPLAPESHWNDLVIIIAVFKHLGQIHIIPRLKEHMEYCINHPEEMSKLSKLKAHKIEVKGIMMDNIEKAFKGLLEEWIRSVIQTHKASELFESRNGLYTLYIKRVICELQKILSPLAKQGKLGMDILSYLTC